MKTLLEVARRLEGMAQNAADRAQNHKESNQMHKIEKDRVVEFIELAQVIHDHIAACPICKPS